MSLKAKAENKMSNGNGTSSPTGGGVVFNGLTEVKSKVGKNLLSIFLYLMLTLLKNIGSRTHCLFVMLL